MMLAKWYAPSQNTQIKYKSIFGKYVCNSYTKFFFKLILYMSYESS